MKYTTVIFDLDGTLLDTLDDLTDGVNHALADFGYPLADREQIRARLGYGSGHLIAESVPGGRDCPDYQAVFDDYLAYYRAHSSVKTRPYGGIPELLASLGRRGVRCAIVSNKPDSAARELGERWFDGLVATTVGDRAGIRRKPAPDTVLEVMRQLDAAPLSLQCFLFGSLVDSSAEDLQATFLSFARSLDSHYTEYLLDIKPHTSMDPSEFRRRAIQNETFGIYPLMNEIATALDTLLHNLHIECADVEKERSALEVGKRKHANRSFCRKCFRTCSTIRTIRNCTGFEEVPRNCASS